MARKNLFSPRNHPSRKRPAPLLSQPELSVSEKLRSDFYKNKLEYPTKASIVALRTLRGEPAPEKVLEGEERQAALEAYREEDGRLSDLFRTEALAELGLAGHPKADKAYSLAWSQGHSAGFSEVYIYLQELAELLLD